MYPYLCGAEFSSEGSNGRYLHFSYCYSAVYCALVSQNINNEFNIYSVLKKYGPVANVLFGQILYLFIWYNLIKSKIDA